MHAMLRNLNQTTSSFVRMYFCIYASLPESRCMGSFNEYIILSSFFYLSIPPLTWTKWTYPTVYIVIDWPPMDIPTLFRAGWKNSRRLGFLSHRRRQTIARLLRFKSWHTLKLFSPQYSRLFSPNLHPGFSKLETLCKSFCLQGNKVP